LIGSLPPGGILASRSPSNPAWLTGAGTEEQAFDAQETLLAEVLFGGIMAAFGALPKEGAVPTITKAQRDGLYELVRNHIAGIGDIPIAMEEKGDFAEAERLGLRFVEDVRLLQDIGWQPHEERERFELTMPVDELTEVLQRLHEEAKQVLIGSPAERRSREQDEEVDQLFEAGLDACEELLIRMDEEGGRSA
jgi:hypothetical protein